MASAKRSGTAGGEPPARSRPRSPRAESSDSSAGAARSVQMAVSVLECFLVTPGLGATGVARRVGVAKSTAHRALLTRAAGGLLDRKGGGR